MRSRHLLLGADGEVSQMSKETKVALGKRLLFLFQCDLLPGISGQILSSKGSRDYVAVKPVTLLAKVVGWSSVVLLNVGMLFYILLFALSQNNHRQGAWFQSFILWLVVEILFVSTAIVAFTHMILPMLAMKDVAKIKQRLLDNIREFHSKMAAREQMDASERAEADAVKPFNAAEYLFVSSRVAARFPEVKEAQIISQFSTPWPRQSYQHVADVSKNYDKKFSAVSRSGSILVLFFLTSLLNVPPNFQDMIIQMVTTTSVGYTILLHIQLFDIFPVLAFGPFLLLCVMVHFWVRSGKAAAKAKLAKLMPSLSVVKNRKQLKTVADVKVESKNDAIADDDSNISSFVFSDDEDFDQYSGFPNHSTGHDEYDLQSQYAAEGSWNYVGGYAIPPTPSCEPSVGHGHVTRRQSVVQGVQLLHQMTTIHEPNVNSFAVTHELQWGEQQHYYTGEYDDHALYQQQQHQDYQRKNETVDGGWHDSISAMSLDNEL